MQTCKEVAKIILLRWNHNKKQNPTKQFKGEKIMKKLTFAELEMVNGGDAVAAEAYLRELRKKYGGKSPLETLAKATSEEVDYLMALYEM